jgi:cytochrome oxidase Cu insertion factor (SCO1/SenC/PrrC family)
MRRPPPRVRALLIAAPVIVLACSSVSPGDPAEITLAETPAAAPAAPAAADAQPSDGPGTADTADAWRRIELTDVASGETFTLASLEGQVVALEPMAVWCTNCKTQQDHVKRAYRDIAAAGVRYVSLGVDPNEDVQALADYAARRGYEWTFARSPKELSRALSDLFGSQILSPPSTPLIVLDASGEVVIQEFGLHDPDALMAILEEAGA